LALAFHISRMATNGMARFISGTKNQPTAQPGVTIMSSAPSARALALAR
jgi:hypothetical protein